MSTWHRHQLVRLHPSAWAQVRARAQASGPVAGACLAHWSARDLPLIVTRQPSRASSRGLSLGLPAPSAWQRLRLLVQSDGAALRPGPMFPSVLDVLPLLPPTEHRPLRVLSEELSGLGVTVRVHGSFGWQHLTGLDHVRPGSDIDLLIDVADPATADAVAARLACTVIEGRRLDGELIFPGDSAVAWREWSEWRGGRCAQVLVKRLQSVALADRLELVLQAPSGSDELSEEAATCLP